ncbi:hypothetical protein CHLRE_01g054850v5 [Chlamydomonas reinhardtii]|uniref:Uncharacterized protein n=1 Tax=Chlamydomonas reinhardtii TaxID=3055 RepID=A0A2K3E8A6_CHLRE|nr:uncharacterized protein CHLRE_01g054850v5 [Chlamydomonas reinhardtii]PNW89016.1 hypothetical protein CHLRE_01g054850v5 [Chlamydomonas reinhardtii]
MAQLQSTRALEAVSSVRGRRAAFMPVHCSASSSRVSSSVSSSVSSRLQPARPVRSATFGPGSPVRSRSAALCSAVANGKLISSTEVPAFIPRDDMMDQLFRWTMMEAGESGQRNFGMPMTIEPVYFEERLWGFNVAIFKEGVKLTDLGVMFDKEVVTKHEWVGRGEDGFPVMEGKADDVKGKMFEIWKMDSEPVGEDLRSTIRAYCTALVAALNRYYAFGSVFVDDAQ